MFIHLLLRYCIYNLLYIFPALLRTQTVKPRMLRIACNCNIIAIFCIIRFDGKVIPGAVRFHTVVIRKAIFTQAEPEEITVTLSLPPGLSLPY